MLIRLVILAEIDASAIYTNRALYGVHPTGPQT